MTRATGRTAAAVPTRKLKVFRTAGGFHDAYVAAPSRAAALRAWGATTDLFAMGAAEQIDDVKLMAKPLASPGTVFKVRRDADSAMTEVAKRRAPKTKPPSRKKLHRAEQALKVLQARQAQQIGSIDKQLSALQEKRRKLIARQAIARERLGVARDKAAQDFEQAGG